MWKIDWDNTVVDTNTEQVVGWVRPTREVWYGVVSHTHDHMQTAGKASKADAAQIVYDLWHQYVKPLEAGGDN